MPILLFKLQYACIVLKVFYCILLFLKDAVYYLYASTLEELRIVSARVVSRLILEVTLSLVLTNCTPVSYTHLDVYKRQIENCG